MVLIGVWPLSTNTMGIKTTDFALLVKNSRDRMPMLSPEGETTSSTATPENRLKLNLYSIACMLKARTKEQQRPTTSWPQVFLSLFQGCQVKVTCTQPPCIAAGLAEFELEHQLLMTLFGCSEMGDTRTIHL